MLTVKEAREFFEQSQKKLEMETPSKSEIRWIERKIKEACEEGKRECYISRYTSMIRNDSYLASRRGDVMIRYLKSQGYEVDLYELASGMERFLEMEIKW